ncbi:MAG TPA: hypothetical protein VFZ21_01565 [Gemmatimonadaceae bacterium]|jgi:hypothetical protein|nr:hypothetical protein [Gemmatimonadaceae bacterium]
MTHPRRPDDARLSTADLAAASERASDRGHEQHQQRVQNQPPAGKTPPDREVTPQNRQVADARATAQRQAAAAQATTPAPGAEHERPSSLFAGNEADDFRHRWADIQTGFVDEPRESVERADALVAAAIKRLAEIFAQERANLEQQWARGGDASTEDLRVALKRYRGFFDRLLSV